MPATNYPDLFAWGVYSRSPDTFGDPKPNEHWRACGKLRGRLETRTATQETRFEGVRQVDRTTIYLRQYLSVKPLDRLTDTQWGDVWTVETARRGDNETIVDVIRKPADE
ncbi:hypothetical protein [Limnoglobus roseus]|uniref:Head-tail adaptor protein n=1 Tax=Limnoglobus roseus TaxID=2598579 RepID=A0A5C1AK05_9BACT|nr:hypothetical protein [Limnoglobus roseus]QEL18533.1 hypothetical protein PX52LOC_05560 [Limnoglobus roseus]